ncbi:MAG: hypothetical protein A3B68_04905 [Candidatus Melainabacteria bacterium RIFCSPHIGHO2_02_FULL_34_12]|nr:MAG: hypothetical protein A3B68_04905 [Candidatus Melainabacteria bacterium RIFCSPHIGHO2_02_FULL_34_12]
MKTNTNEEISFTNCYGGLYLNKQEGTIAIDFKSSELVLYFHTSLYQSLAWLLHTASDCEELMRFVNWTVDPKSVNKNTLIEVHGPEHAACLICSPSHERVQLNLEIGVSVDLKFTDFKGILELIKEAQNDLEWRRQLLQWSLKLDIDPHSDSKDIKDKKVI